MDWEIVLKFFYFASGLFVLNYNHNCRGEKKEKERMLVVPDKQGIVKYTKGDNT